MTIVAAVAIDEPQIAPKPPHASTVAIARGRRVGGRRRSTGLSSSSSGAISWLAYGGKQWIFIAARSTGVVAIDVTDLTVATPTVKVYSSW